MKPCEYNATVIHKQLLTPTLAIFRVVADTSVEPFVPGQYTVLGLNHPEKGPVLRAYSIASAPYQAGEYLEFYIRYVAKPTSDNPLTHLLFAVEEGQRVHMRTKCRGKFTLEHTTGADDPRLKVFVAAGTGLAPFRSMVLEHAHQHGGEAGNFAIVHGASYAPDLGYREEMLSIMGGRHLPTISRPQGTDWDGMKGRAESHFDPDKIEALEAALGLEPGGLNPGKAAVLICGLQGTIAQTAMNCMYRGFVPEDRKVRKALGVPDDTAPSLFWEQYDTEPVIDLKDEVLVGVLAERLRSAGVNLLPPQPATT